MSKENSSPPAQHSPPAHHRRASFSPGQTFTELFSRSPGTSGPSTGTTAFPGHIATAAANAQTHQRRRMSISTLGLSGSPTQTSPFLVGRTRGESYSSSNSGSQSIDESAVEDGDATPMSTPTTPFARRMSFGARALRDARSGNGNTPGRASVIPASSPTAKGRGEGFNWSESLRSKAERTSSISASSPVHAAPAPQQRAASVAVMEPPVKEMPKAPKAPDAFQERILKGDFYMD